MKNVNYTNHKALKRRYIPTAYSIIPGSVNLKISFLPIKLPKRVDLYIACWTDLLAKLPTDMKNTPDDKNIIVSLSEAFSSVVNDKTNIKKETVINTVNHHSSLRFFNGLSIVMCPFVIFFCLVAIIISKGHFRVDNKKRK
jgi:hypothetical protein